MVDEQKGWIRTGTGPWHRWTGYIDSGSGMARPFCGARMVPAKISQEKDCPGGKTCTKCEAVARWVK